MNKINTGVSWGLLRVLCVLGVSLVVDCSACQGNVEHPVAGEKGTAAYCANASAQESNCMACTAKPGCGYCGAAVGGAAACQPGVTGDNKSTSCETPLFIGSQDCPAPPPPVSE
jgi:hypothetical protein